MVRLQGHLPCSYSTHRVTYLRVFFTMSTNSLFGGENLTHQFTHHTTSHLDHNFYTTSSHQYAAHQSSLQLSSTHQSSISHLSSQLTYFTTNQLLLSTQLLYLLNKYSQLITLWNNNQWWCSNNLDVEITTSCNTSCFEG